jgi:predicted TIM-barrel fold metal-dependent hydrolase
MRETVAVWAGADVVGAADVGGADVGAVDVGAAEVGAVVAGADVGVADLGIAVAGDAAVGTGEDAAVPAWSVEAQDDIRGMAMSARPRAPTVANRFVFIATAPLVGRVVDRPGVHGTWRVRPSSYPPATARGRIGVVTVDSHVHLLPPRLAEAIRGFFAQHGLGLDTWRYSIDHDEITRRLAAEGVTEAWSLPYARRPGTATELNRSSAATVAAQADGPVAIVGGATVHPGDDDPRAVVRAAVEDLGLRCLKLHCSVGDYRPDDPRLDAVWDYVSQIRLPVVVHAGHAVSGHTSTEEIAPLATVATRWPEARMIVAHCGYHAVDATLDLVETHEAVHADLTPVVHDPVEFPPGRIAALADKLLFGSDCPNTAVTVTDGLDRIAALGLSDTQRKAICEGNARRLQREVRT